jgi:hypothetical protein
MIQKLRNSKRTLYLVACTLLVCLATLILSAVTHSGRGIPESTKETVENAIVKSTSPQADTKFDPLKYLPAGAHISNPDEDVLLADLGGDGAQEAIIFYTMLVAGKGQADILVLKKSGVGYERLWENTYEGSAGFADPSGVYDLNKIGRPQIVAYRIVGASCPGVLDIFQYTNGRIEKITGDWAGTCQSDLEIKDLDGDGVSEVIFRPLKYGVNRMIYTWNGKEYVRTDKQHARYFNDELQQLVGWIYEHRPLPTPTRAALCEQAVQIYMLQTRYREAIELCKAVLPMIDDPELTVPSTSAATPEQQNRVSAYFEVDKTKDKSRVYRLLADASKANGDIRSARKYLSETRRLESEVAERRSRLQF